MSDYASRFFDVIILGATGFTGKLIVKEYLRMQSELKIGLAGRSMSRLTDLRNSHPDCEYPIMEADVASENKERLVELCGKTRVLINCVGPFALYGERVVEACIEAGTHYIDINGEPAFMASCMKKYNKAANEAGCYIVQACGMDSIPADLGAYRTENLLLSKGYDESSLVVEAAVNLDDFSISRGTLRTAVNSLRSARESKRKSAPRPAQVGVAKKPKSKMHYDKDFNGYLLPFPVADPFVVRATHKRINRSDIEYHHYALCKNRLEVAWLMFLGFAIVFFSYLTEFWLGRKLFEGVFLKLISGPSVELQKNGRIRMLLKGSGKRSDTGDSSGTVMCSWDIPEGYYGTAIMAIHSVECLISEELKLNAGGVYTPIGGFGAAIDSEMSKDERFVWSEL